MSTYYRIHNKGDWRHDENVAHAAISPGNILELNSDNEVLKHATENGALVDGKLIAVEDALQGNGVTDDYAADDRVMIAIAASGSEWNILVAAATVLTIGENLVSDGSGCLMSEDDLSSGTTAEVIAVALEEYTVDSGEAELVHVRIL
jgi:hypothetical protein